MNSSSVSNSELHNGVPLEQVFSEYYDAHSDAIFRFCFFQTGDRNISLDIMQETFTKAWEALTAGTVLENPRAFLYRVAKNKVIDYYRKKRSVSLDEMLSEGIEFGGVDEEADLVLKDEAGRLYELVDDLDARSREIITLRYGEDLSIPEISEMLGISENNASVRLHRALKKLEEKTNEIN